MCNISMFPTAGPGRYYILERGLMLEALSLLDLGFPLQLPQPNSLSELLLPSLNILVQFSEKYRTKFK